MSHTGLSGEHLVSKLMVLFWEVMETLGSGASLEEVGHWWCDFKGHT
jgi:hypothetical protein